FYNYRLDPKHYSFPTRRSSDLTLLYQVRSEELRPGGTVSGPTMMTLADFALYVAILGEIGLVGLAVTTNLNINFLRKPSGGTDIDRKSTRLNSSHVKNSYAVFC